jgi:hypothetical protein
MVCVLCSQVRMICERMLREQEAALRAEYESALSTKLAEQYEAFVRFNLDQVYTDILYTIVYKVPCRYNLYHKRT